MRLLNVDTYRLEEFFYVDPPPYAILSHTWGSDSEEVSYRDVLDGRLDHDSTRPYKVTGCCEQAKLDGYRYVWIDTCCIDKTNSVELQEAINSMFRWYRNAAICYAYLSDVPFQNHSKAALLSSRWFERGWTLQELLAPLNLRFYDQGWACMGTKGDLCDTVEAITGIPTPYLLGITELHHASVAQRMSWAAKRVTKRQEDIAYCLLGIFGVSMPMIYGEGDKAFRRLQEQIMKDLGDDSILAWHLDPRGEILQKTANAVFGTVLAPAPSYFANSGQVVAMGHPSHSSFEVHGGTLRLSLTLQATLDGQIVGLLKCGLERDPEKVVAIPLAAAPGERDKYFRLEGRRARLLPNPKSGSSARLVHIQLDGGRKPPSQSAEVCWFHVRKAGFGLQLIGVHPVSCWHKERALIEATVEPTANGPHRILARFRTEGKSADFVAVLALDSGAQPRCSLMVASRKTSLEEIAGNAEAWKDKITGKTRANNGDMQLAVVLETLQASSSQRRFVLKLVVDESETVPVTVNVTATLELSGATALLDDLRRVDEQQKQEANGLKDHIKTKKQILAHKQAEMERIRAQISALQKQERRLTAEYELERRIEAELLEHCSRVKNKGAVLWDRMLRLEWYINLHTAGEEDSETGDALSKTAAQILPFAIQKGYDSLARQLLERAASISETDLGGISAFEHAIVRGDEDLIRLLIEKGADVNPSDARKEAPLHLAVVRGSEEIVRLLIAKGADVRRVTYGATPLHVAVKLGFEGIARLLIENGANVTATDSHGFTPLQIAREKRYHNLSKLLTEHATNATSHPFARLKYQAARETPREIPVDGRTLPLTRPLETKSLVSPPSMPRIFSRLMAPGETPTGIPGIAGTVKMAPSHVTEPALVPSGDFEFR
jgi:ankyrin repeat protein